LKEYVKVVAVIPVGPDCHEGFVAGVIESIARYMTPSHRIVLADDSGRGTGRRLQAKLPNVDFVTGAAPSPAAHTYGGPNATVLRAFAHAADLWRFDAVLHLEAGAVVLRPQAEEEALRLFLDRPGVGIAGPVPPEGLPRENARARERALHRPLNHLAARLRNPVAVSTLGRLFNQAEANGYTAEANRYGGVYFLSEACIHQLIEADLLPAMRLGSLDLPGDALIGLLVAAVGMDFGILSPAEPAFAGAWYGLLTPRRASRAHPEADPRPEPPVARIRPLPVPLAARHDLSR
jgi:hypothetical protein